MPEVRSARLTPFWPLAYLLCVCLGNLGTHDLIRTTTKSSGGGVLSGARMFAAMWHVCKFVRIIHTSFS